MGLKKTVPLKESSIYRGFHLPRFNCMPKFWLWQSSENGRVLNMPKLHSVLNMREYTLNSECILGSKYARMVNMEWF